MLHNELFYTLALLKVEGIGDVVAKKLIKHCGSPSAVFQTSKKSLVAIDGIGHYLYKNLQEKIK
jgi:DNA processing protein